MGQTWAKPADPTPSLDTLSSLATRIEKNTEVLVNDLRSKGLSAPSFDAHGLADLDAKLLDKPAQVARAEIIELTQRLHDLVVGPKQTLKDFAWENVNYISLHAISEFKIAEAVPQHGSIKYEDLTARLRSTNGMEIDCRDVKRLLRLAMANNMFHEPQAGYVAHNRLSLLLIEDEALGGWAGMYTTDLMDAIAKTVPAMKKWPGSQEPNQTGVNLAFDHSLPFFEHLQLDQARTRRYDLSMQANGKGDDWNVSHTIKGYQWGELGKARVVDAGGNDGHVSVGLAHAFPDLSFIVQDLAGMRTADSKAAIPRDVSGRVTLTTHDFFTPQPVVADVYFFRYIFHAFSDKFALNILRALIPALRPGARIIINDFILPAPGSLPIAEEKRTRIMDVLMKTVTNAGERELQDWRALFEAADSRFKWVGAKRTTGALSMIEIVWEG